MRTYTVDELTEEDIGKLSAYLSEINLQSSVQGMFWLPIPLNLHTDLQKSHLEECGAYCLALELGKGAIHLEFLVRAKGKMRCECMCFASPALREHMINYLDGVLSSLGVEF